MLTHILRRAAFAVPNILAISVVTFWIIDMSPADPCSQMGPGLDAEQRRIICAQFNTDDPFVVRYGRWAHQFFINEPLYWLGKA